MANAKPTLSHAVARLLLLSAFVWPALASAEAISWASLSVEQQVTLADFEARWNDIPDSRRAQLIERAERWRNMPDERRQAILSRWNELKALSPEARQALRQRWNTLTPDERRQAMGTPTSDGTLATSN